MKKLFWILISTFVLVSALMGFASSVHTYTTLVHDSGAYSISCVSTQSVVVHYTAHDSLGNAYPDTGRRNETVVSHPCVAAYAARANTLLVLMVLVPFIILFALFYWDFGFGYFLVQLPRAWQQGAIMRDHDLQVNARRREARL